MKWNKKIEAFTLSEMIVVLILTSIVVGLAFSVLTLVQRHMATIQKNFNHTTELNKLEQSLWLDFNRYSRITYDSVENKIQFTSELDSVTYQFNEKNIIKALDTFHIELSSKTLFFDGELIETGPMDALKLETSKTFQNQHLFVFKKNDANLYMDWMAFQLDNTEIKKKPLVKEGQVTSILQKEITFGNPFSNKIKEDFYTELSVLLKAGVNLKTGLELIHDSQKKKQNKDILHTISHEIVSGKSLSDAVHAKKQFTDYEYYSLKIGEETGTLAQVAEQLGSFFARKNEQRRNLISALTYPVIILTTAVLVVVFMLQFVVPMFQDIFKQQNVELPMITKFIIQLSNFMQDYGWLFIFMVAALFLSRMFLNKNEWYRHTKDNLILKLPFFGNFVKTVYLSQFTQAISLLTASKVPVVNSIQLVKQMINFYPLQHALEKVEAQLLQGTSLSESLRQHKLFDDKMIALVKVSEETNQTEFIFDRLNQQYNTQVQQQSKMLSTIMEPMIILFVGVLVGVILVAMYLPMFKLSSVMG